MFWTDVTLGDGFTPPCSYSTSGAVAGGEEETRGLRLEGLQIHVTSHKMSGCSIILVRLVRAYVHYSETDEYSYCQKLEMCS